jgi:energy-coupling factor transporter ATP-binding protein EcfA2
MLAMGKQYHVFLSHNNIDKPLVEAIARRLREMAHLEPFLDTWHVIPGAPWQEARERALDASHTCAVLLGPSGLGTWENEVMRVALHMRVANPDFRVIPVLLPGAQLPELGRLPPFLARLKWVDFRAGIDDAQAFHELVSGIQGIAPDPMNEPIASNCPFRGLQAFEEEHAEFFFGREALTQHLVEQLRTDRFLAVIGPSGSGKSSLVRAGLIPSLRQGILSGSAAWSVVVFKPGPHPLENLASKLLAHIAGRVDPLRTRQLILDALQRDESGLHTMVQVALSAAPTTQRLLLVIDQFEELFTLCRDEFARSAFIANLLYASTITGGQSTAVIMLRADFFGKCASYAHLASRIADHDVLVGSMDIEDLRQTMLGPANKVGLNYEKGLIHTILDDLGNEPGNLPLLQHTLLELWERRRGGWLTTDAYHSIGGVQGALAQRADTVYETLTQAQQIITRRLLLRLTQPGEGTGDTRRRATLTELMPSNNNKNDVEVVVRELTDARLLTTDKDERGSEVVDVVHEALIRGWPLLRSWIEENREALRIHRRLTEVSNEWVAQNNDVSYLYRGVRLAEAEGWSSTYANDLNDVERAFLEESVLARETERQAAKRRVRRTIGSLFVALLLISGLASVALVLWYISEDRQASFQAEAKRASDSQATAQAEAKRASDSQATAQAEAKRASDSQATAQAEAERSEKSALLARARLLVSEGRGIFEERPLLGLRLALEGLATLPSDNTQERPSILATIAEMAKAGRSLKLTADMERSFPSPNSSVFVLNRREKSSELRRTIDGALITSLTSKAGIVEFSKDVEAKFVLLRYIDESGELRRSVDGALITSLPGKINTMIFSRDSEASLFLVGYKDARPGELRRSVDGALVTLLPGKINRVDFSENPAAPSIVIVYQSRWPPTSSELRRFRDFALIASLPSEVRETNFSPDLEQTFIDLRYFGDTPAEVRRSIDGSILLTGPIVGVDFSPDPKSIFIVSYLNNPKSELRHASDGVLLETLPDIPWFVDFDSRPTTPVFTIIYKNTHDSELRRVSDGKLIRKDVGYIYFSHPAAALYVFDRYVFDRREWSNEIRSSTDDSLVATFRGSVKSLFFTPDPRGHFFVTNYYNNPSSELRRSTDASLITEIPGIVTQLYYSPQTNFIILGYSNDDNTLSELRNSVDGALITTLSGTVNAVEFSQDPTLNLFVVHYRDGRSELWDWQNSPHRLIDLGLGQTSQIFIPKNQRVLVWYTDGRAYLLDVAWLRAMGSDPTRLAPNELVRLACQEAINSGLWVAGDQSALIQTLNGNEPQACLGIP